MAEDRQSFSIKEDKSGTVHVAGEVVAIIAGLAATEVEGVSSMAGNITNEYPSFIISTPSLMVLSDSLASPLRINKLPILNIHLENTGMLASSSFAIKPVWCFITFNKTRISA